MTEDEESVRFKALNKISIRSLEESVKYLTIDRLASCYPTIASTEKGTNALKQARSQIVSHWHTTATKEFQNVFEERNMRQKLFELDELIARARSRKELAEEERTVSDRPLFADALTPSQIVEAHLRPLQLAEIERVEKELEAVKKENEELLKRVETDFTKVQSTAEDIQSFVEEVENAVHASESLPTRPEIGRWVKKVEL